MAINLTFGGGEYNLTAPLLTGEVEPQGVNLNSVTYPSATRHWRMLRHQEFDVCELSLSSYLLSRTNAEAYPFTAIPVFPHRLFRHSYMFKHSGADVQDPGDLGGKNVVIRTWQTTSGVWMRGIACEEYGLDLESVTWYVDDTEDVPIEIPDRFDIRQLREDQNLEEMLLDGDLDGAMYPVIMDSVRDPNASVERIFSNYKEVETEYYRKTGIFPPMHTVVVRNEVLDRYPWIAVNLYEAFEQARDRCLQNLEDPRTSPFVWPHHHLEEQQRIFGGNPWEYGLTDSNRRALSKLQEYADNQGIIPSEYDFDELFVETTLDEELRSKGYVSGSHD